MLDTIILDTRTKSAEGLLLLEGVKGIGRVAITKLLDSFETFGEILDADDATIKSCLNVKQRDVMRDIKTLDTAHRAAAKTVKRAADIDAHIVTMYDADYPSRLHAVDNAPFVLYYSGDLSILDKSIAFVGTRKPTKFGESAAYRMASTFAENGWCIVSGLAMGVDRTCHTAAVDSGGTTCAVLASGLDRFDGTGAMEMAQRIDQSGGLLISEQPFGAEPNQGSYIDRDRLITGLSAATFVIQGNGQSGTMHSLRYAVAQGKPVYAPNVPDAYRHEPENELARNLSLLTVGQLATKYQWVGKVMDIVLSDPDRSMAEIIMNRDDYPWVLSQLEALLPENARRPRAEMRMAPGM